MLEVERKFYAERVAEWLKTMAGKFVVIKGATLVGAYDTMEQALAAGAAQFGLESFLVRRLGEVEQEVRLPALTLGLIGADTPRPDHSSTSAA